MPTCELCKCPLCGYVFYASPKNCLVPAHGSPSPTSQVQGCPGAGQPAIPLVREKWTEWKNTD